jgi:hypothetical protein
VKAVRITVDRTADLAKRIAELTKTRVLVGVPSDDEQPHLAAGPVDPNERRDESGTTPINNATLAYIHDNGAPEANIPARPFMLPGMERAKPAVTRQLSAAGMAALGGDMKGMTQGFHGAGLKAVDGIRLTIQEGIPPPLAQATINRRRQRTRGSSYRRKAQTAADTKPLIDTGQMIAALSYIIRKSR